MSDESQLDHFLERAFAHGVVKQPGDDDTAVPEPVPEELLTSLLGKARATSSIILAKRIVSAAARLGWSAEDLAHEAIDEESAARQFLASGGDPRLLTPASFARLFWQVRLKPVSWAELLTQAVASFVVFPRRGDEDLILGRTTGLSGERRADSLTGFGAERNPRRAKKVADNFVEEVIEEWTTLTERAGGSHPRNE